MKQGTQFVLPVEIGLDLDDVSRIEFVFKQNTWFLALGYAIIRVRLLRPVPARTGK